MYNLKRHTFKYGISNLCEFGMHVFMYVISFFSDLIFVFLWSISNVCFDIFSNFLSLFTNVLLDLALSYIFTYITNRTETERETTDKNINFLRVTHYSIYYVLFLILFYVCFNLHFNKETICNFQWASVLQETIININM